MKIAILGWGSLIWERNEAFDSKRHDRWESDGPRIRIEFSRISRTREGALTLVIDERNGELTQVMWCLSKQNNLEAASARLRIREGTSKQNIGRSSSAPPTEKWGKTTGPAGAAIEAWRQSMSFEAVIWTALTSNFEHETGRPFTVPAAISYIEGLPAEGRSKATEYVRNAPECVTTPVRRALQSKSWFGART